MEKLLTIQVIEKISELYVYDNLKQVEISGSVCASVMNAINTMSQSEISATWEVKVKSIKGEVFLFIN